MLRPLLVIAAALAFAPHAGAGTLFVLDGRGWGHGVGMSQYGADGYAHAGWGYQRILTHYYTGTEIRVMPTRPVRVLLAEGLPAVVISSTKPFRVVDARGKARFEGSEPDPRPGVAAGHIPGARNLPFGALYNDDGTFRGRDEIRALFEGAGIDPEQPFVASCGSGVTANSLIFAAQLLGNSETRLYDGSWSEWGSDPEAPKALGRPSRGRPSTPRRAPA